MTRSMIAGDGSNRPGSAGRPRFQNDTHMPTLQPVAGARPKVGYFQTVRQACFLGP